MGALIKRYLPKSLLGRSLLIIVMPLILLQLVSGVVFYETHWSKISLRLARSVAGDIAAVVNLMHSEYGPDGRRIAFRVASVNMGFGIEFREGAVLTSLEHRGSGLMERMLIRALQESNSRPFQIDSLSLKRHVTIDIQLADGVLHVIASRKRLFSSTTYVFVLWMVGTSLILFAVATIFMRNQVKPIRRLAVAAKDFGKGRDVSKFKPEGAMEVRQAAAEFLDMRDRISRQIKQRTDMLAGVSHDLRTPLTRMRLELEMLGDDVAAKNLKSDVTDMEHMLEGYLAFARGEGTEQPSPTDLVQLVEGVVGQARRKGGQIDFHGEGEVLLPLRPNAFKRSVTNLIDNATRFGEHVSVRVRQRDTFAELLVDDDGPGIPEQERDDVFKPFYRVEGSRNQGTGGVGLGLTIVRDVVRAHGGDIELDHAPVGGLRVRVRLPI
jgi:two-component system, OmpR family, osmolarity sensor histidine kinase EnvZ